MEKRGDGNKYNRREFLKASGKTAGGAAFYGTVGGFIGRGYEGLKNIFYSGTRDIGNRLTKVEDKVDSLSDYHPAKVAKEVEETRSNFWRDLFGRSEKDQSRWREEYEIKHPKSYKPVKSASDEKKIGGVKNESRRSFLRLMLGYAHEHPVSTGVGVGAGYGGVKTGMRSAGKYHARKETNELRKRVDDFEEELRGLKEGDLEKEVDEGPKITIILSLIGIFISLGFITSNFITGRAISEASNKLTLSVGIFLFLFFLIILFISIKVK